MVHDKPAYSWQGDERNDYWKLEHYGGLRVEEMRSMLAERGYDHGSARSVEKLR